MKCKQCGKDTFLPFKCQYCSGYFCAEHRLPENHECTGMEEARSHRGETQSIVVQKQRSPEYNMGYPSQAFSPRNYVTFSSKELQHLAVAAVLVTGVGVGLAFEWITIANYWLITALIAMFASSFLIHEIAHKVVAQKYHLWAEFRLTLMGTILTAISIISPLKVISPGAVMIGGPANRKILGRTSIAGPLSNIALASITSILFVLLPANLGVFGSIFAFNAWIALINLIPIGILDGLKIFKWNKLAWASTFLVSLALVAWSLALLYGLRLF